MASTVWQVGSEQVAGCVVRPPEIRHRPAGDGAPPTNELERDLEILDTPRISERHPRASQSYERVSFDLHVTHIPRQLDRGESELATCLRPGRERVPPRAFGDDESLRS